MALQAVQLKKTSSVDFFKPLKKFIKNTFADQYSEDEFDSQLAELNKLRADSVVRKLDRHASSLESLTRYYDQLAAIENKFPIVEGQISISFCWYDVFDPGSLFGSKKGTTTSATYEKMCVLFNVAAMQSQIGALQNLDDEDGLKTAAKYFQQSAGIFKHLSELVYTGFHPVLTPDMSTETLNSLSSFMLAQAQECIVTKAKKDNMKDAVISKLANGASDMFAECLVELQKGPIKSLLPPDWLSTVAGKQALMHAYSEYHQAKVCQEKAKYGEAIARLTHALELLKAADTRSAGLLKIGPLKSKMKRELDQNIKDNNLIYNDKVPKQEELTSPDSARVAKALEPKTPMTENFSDLFEKLVPIPLHNAVVAFETKKAEIVNREIGKIRENTQLLNTVLASLNLPASIEDLAGEKVPSSLLEKSKQLTERGGLESLDKLIQDLPDLLQRNTEILNETIRQLDEEEKEDKQMRDRFKEKWSRLPSDQLTVSLRSEGGKYRAILNNAIQADSVVKEKYNSNRDFIKILSSSEGEISAWLPAASAASALKDSQVVQELRTHINNVDAIKNEREVLENEIKSASCDIKSIFEREGLENQDRKCDEKLDEMFNGFIQQVQESVKRQEFLLNNIQDANTRFTNAKQQNVSGTEREAKLKSLASGFDVFMELQANLTEGTKFYNDLTEILLRYQSKVSDLCFARKTEKEDMSRDIQHTLANSPPASIPNHPAGKQPPARPPPPTRPPATAPAPQPAAPPPASAPAPAAPATAPYPVQAYNTMPAYAPYGYAPMPQPFVNYQAPYQPMQGYPPQQYGNPYQQPGYGYQPPRQ